MGTSDDQRARARERYERELREADLLDKWTGELPALAASIQHVHAFKGAPWISCKVATIEEALAALRALDQADRLLTAEYVSIGGIRYVGTREEILDSLKGRAPAEWPEANDFLWLLDARTGERWNAVEARAWIGTGGQLAAEVHLKVEPAPWALVPRVRTKMVYGQRIVRERTPARIVEELRALSWAAEDCSTTCPRRSPSRRAEPGPGARAARCCARAGPLRGRDPRGAEPMRTDDMELRDAALDEIGQACGLIREGLNGVGQIGFVRGMLRTLERCGLARYRGEEWYLTESGKKRARTWRRAARKLQHAAGGER